MNRESKSSLLKTVLIASIMFQFLLLISLIVYAGYQLYALETVNEMIVGALISLMSGFGVLSVVGFLIQPSEETQAINQSTAKDFALETKDNK